jgi:hypothetical protein
MSTSWKQCTRPTCFLLIYQKTASIKLCVDLIILMWDYAKMSDNKKPHEFIILWIRRSTWEGVNDFYLYGVHSFEVSLEKFLWNFKIIKNWVSLQFLEIWKIPQSLFFALSLGSHHCLLMLATFLHIFGMHFYILIFWLFLTLVVSFCPNSYIYFPLTHIYAQILLRQVCMKMHIGLSKLLDSFMWFS